MSPTEEIKSKLSLTTIKEPSDARYESYDMGSCEIAVLEFLYSFVKYHEDMGAYKLLKGEVSL